MSKAILRSSDEYVTSSKKLRRELACAVAANAAVEHPPIEDTPLFRAVADYVNQADGGFVLAELGPGHIAVLDADDDPICHVFQRIEHESGIGYRTRTPERMLADVVQFIDAYFTVIFARSGAGGSVTPGWAYVKRREALAARPSARAKVTLGVPCVEH